MSAPVFRPDALDILIERFPDDGCGFAKPGEDDPIALLFDMALAMIARTGRVLRQAAPGGKCTLAEGAGAFYHLGNVDILVRLRDLIDEDFPDQVFAESAACLDFLRAEYRIRVRGQRPECWKELQSGRDLPGRGCGLRGECSSEGASADHHAQRSCDTYRDGWRRTALAVASPPHGSSAELSSLLLEACPGLGLLTDRLDLQRALEAEFRSPGAPGGQRSLRGHAVRLCTDLVEHGLAELSLRHGLPGERRLSLLS